ncbi:MAG: histidine phosphatase family protein [Firmicutes bacterium]|jgi:phosphohistidine phosphatase|nr:histidine phosphatase family protein [Bacillota bacterium]
MKNMIIIRHGKAEHSGEKADINRRLTDEGVKSINALGKYLLSIDLLPDIIVSSDAMRAKMTADIVAREVHCKNIIYKDLLYAGTFEEILIFYESLRERNVLIVGHNPTLDKLIAHMLEIPCETIHLSTGSMIHLNFSHDKWKLKNFMKSKELNNFIATI